MAIATYHGYIGTSHDALVIIELVIQGKLAMVSRRATPDERKQVGRLGNVFVFTETHLGIRRWTDGLAWLSLRIIGRFLVYRQMDRQARLRPTMSATAGNLVKKSISVTTEFETFHLVLYFTVDEVVLGKLNRPVDDEKVGGIKISEQLMTGLRRNSIGKHVEEEGPYLFLNADFDIQEMPWRHNLAPAILESTPLTMPTQHYVPMTMQIPIEMDHFSDAPIGKFEMPQLQGPARREAWHSGTPLVRRFSETPLIREQKEV